MHGHRVIILETDREPRLVYQGSRLVAKLIFRWYQLVSSNLSMMSLDPGLRPLEEMFDEMKEVME